MKKKTLAMAAFVSLSPILQAVGSESETSEKTKSYADSVRTYEQQRAAIVKKRGVTDSARKPSSNAALIEAEVPKQDSPMATGEQD
jgi:hypothetical protein